MMELSIAEDKELDKAFSDWIQEHGTARCPPFRMFEAGWKAKKLKIEEQEDAEIDERLRVTFKADASLDRMLELIKDTNKCIESVSEKIDEANKLIGI
jgi:hypothetical protein